MVFVSMKWNKIGFSDKIKINSSFKDDKKGILDVRAKTKDGVHWGKVEGGNGDASK